MVTTLLSAASLQLARSWPMAVSYCALPPQSANHGAAQPSPSVNQLHQELHVETANQSEAVRWPDRTYLLRQRFIFIQFVLTHNKMNTQHRKHSSC